MFSSVSFSAVAVTALSLVTTSTAEVVEGSTRAPTYVPGGNSNLATYWGAGANQKGLAAFCNETTLDIIPVGFLNAFPAQGNGLPGFNAANACWGGVDSTYDGPGDEPLENLLPTRCPNLQQDIPTCQALGKKILLSLGGDTSVSPYQLTGASDGLAFAEWIWGAYGPYNQTWVDNAPTNYRPLDRGLYNDDASPYYQIDIDGFDFDIERSPTDSSEGYIAMVTRLRQLMARDNPTKTYILSAAPECGLSGNDMADLISGAKFDLIWVQFYNNPACAARQYIQQTGTNHFNFDDWVTFVNSGLSTGAKIYAGLPAAVGKSNYVSDYLQPSEVQSLVEHLQATFTQFGGVMLWEATAALGNIVTGLNSVPSSLGNNVTYYEAVKYYLDGNKLPPPPPTTTSTSTSKTSSTTKVTTTSTSTTSTYPVSPVTTSTTTSTTTSKSTTSTSSVPTYPVSPLTTSTTTSTTTSKSTTSTSSVPTYPVSPVTTSTTTSTTTSKSTTSTSSVPTYPVSPVTTSTTTSTTTSKSTTSTSSVPTYPVSPVTTSTTTSTTTSKSTTSTSSVPTYPVSPLTTSTTTTKPTTTSTTTSKPTTSATSAVSGTVTSSASTTTSTSSVSTYPVSSNSTTTSGSSKSTTPCTTSTTSTSTSSASGTSTNSGVVGTTSTSSVSTYPVSTLTTSSTTTASGSSTSPTSSAVGTSTNSGVVGTTSTSSTSQVVTTPCTTSSSVATSSPTYSTQPSSKPAGTSTVSGIVSSSSSSALTTPVSSYPAQTSSPASYTISTVYTTSVYTQSSGGVTTSIISLYTTTCPVAATQTPTAPSYPTTLPGGEVASTSTKSTTLTTYITVPVPYSTETATVVPVYPAQTVSASTVSAGPSGTTGAQGQYTSTPLPLTGAGARIMGSNAVALVLFLCGAMFLA